MIKNRKININTLGLGNRENFLTSNAEDNRPKGTDSHPDFCAANFSRQ